MTQDWSSLSRRVASRWQFPALLLSGALLTSAVLRLRPSPADMPLDQAATHLGLYVDGGLYETAVDLGWQTLHRDNALDTEALRAPVRLQQARALFGFASESGGSRASVGADVVEQYLLASENGQALTGADYRNLGQAFEWTARFGDAVDAYAEAVSMSGGPELDLRRHMYLLLRDQLGADPHALQAMSQGILEDAGNRLDDKIWALHEQLYLLGDLGQMDEGTTLLLRHRDDFADTPRFPEFRFLEAFQFYQTQAFDSAEALLRTVRNGLQTDDPVHAMTGWLLGRAVMHDGGPQRPTEALSFFSDVIAHHVAGPYVTASRVGSAEAMAYLERHRDAVNEFRTAIEEMASLPINRLVNRDALRVRLTLLADAFRRRGELEPAVEYSRLAGTLIDWAEEDQAAVTLQQLAQLRGSLADELSVADAPSSGLAPREPTDEEAQRHSRLAGETHLEIARLSVVNEERAARHSWQAADHFAAAGERDRAVGLFRNFAKERPNHPLVARALLRIGQIEHESGRLSAAVEAYRECYRRFPRTIDGARALVPLARAYMGLGPDHLELAEKTLGIVLHQSQLFTPDAPEFADALFLLGDTQARREHYEDAIATLEEALDRYPDDPRSIRARFLLADAYRQSGLALKAGAQEASLPGEIEQMRVEAGQRFQQSGRLFRGLIDTLGESPVDINEIYQRHAYLYEADAEFEMQHYEEALKLYEDAAGLYKDRPAGLAAYVQIINCHVFLGQPEEARAALARVRVLVDDMPQTAFEESASPERREDWKRYFDWLSESEAMQSMG